MVLRESKKDLRPGAFAILSCRMDPLCFVISSLTSCLTVVKKKKKVKRYELVWTFSLYIWEVKSYDLMKAQYKDF